MYLYTEYHDYLMANIKLEGYKCERCGHTWVPREKDKPKVCPKCKSPYWDTPRKQ